MANHTATILPRVDEGEKIDSDPQEDQFNLDCLLDSDNNNECLQVDHPIFNTTISELPRALVIQIQILESHTYSLFENNASILCIALYFYNSFTKNTHPKTQKYTC